MVDSRITEDPAREVLEALVASVIANSQDEAAFQGLSLLDKLVSNIVKNPTEDKYKKFKKTNPKIAGTVLSLQGGINDLILAMGFTSGVEHYEFTGEMTNLKKGSKAMEKALEPMQVARMTPEERGKHELL
jgi:hypothetical protein